MLKKIAILFFTIFFLISCLVLYLKINDSTEINVNYINFYLKNKISNNSNVDINNTALILKTDNKESCLIITGLTVKNSDFIIKIPKLFIYFKMSSLLRMKINFSQILIDEAYVHVNKKTNFKAVKFDLKNSLQMASDFFLKLNQNAKIEFTNIVINKGTEDEIYIDKFHLSKKENLSINIRTRDNKEILDNLVITIKKHNNLFHVYGDFHNIKLGLFSNFSSLIESNKLSKDTEFKGDFLLKINQKNEILAGDLNIFSANTNPTMLNNVNVKLTYYNNIISIKNFHLKLADIYISLIGKVNLGTENALLRVNINKFTIKDLCSYVPDELLSDEFKNWLYYNVDGNILNTIIDFSGKVNSSSISDVQVTADIENGSVKFDDDFERIEKLNGSLKIKNNNLEITFDHAQFQSFNVIKGEVQMNSFNKNDALLVIRGQALGSAYALYEPIKFKLDKVVEIKETNLSGNVNSKFNIQVFNLNADNKKMEFLANFDIKIDDLAIYNGSIGKHDVKLNFGNDFIDLNSSGIVNNKQLIFDFKEHNKNFSYKIKGDLPAQMYQDIDGYISVNIESIIDSNNIGFINGAIDLSDLILHSSYLGWKNRSEDYNKIIFSVNMEGEEKFLFNKLDITGNDIDIKLNGKLENENLFLRSTIFNLPNNNFNIEVELNKKKVIVSIDGEKIHLGDILGFFTKSNNGSERDIGVNMRVDTILMKDDIIINNAELNLTCVQGNCNGSHFTGKFLQDENSNILAKYSEIGFEIYADDAEMLFRSLGISNSFKNGKLSFYLSPQRGDTKHYGMVSISNFYIKDAPILTTLLSMSSLPGIVNTLKKEGIYFYRCNIPFTYSNSIVEIEESLLEGTELGMITSGNLDIRNGKFNVTGQVIPAYSVNKFLLKIPIIGKILTGGKSRGVIGIDYKANGDSNNNNVSVNFISSLTPSLLKRMLGIFDRIMIKTNQNIKNYMQKQSKSLQPLL